MLNPHYVELFYHVARHGGISRAVRHMPYGIQQPALSGQILKLERELGCKLFERAPFRLTAEGEALYEFARPFFENLDRIELRLRSGLAPQLRIGAGETVLREHLPAVLRQLRTRQPKFQLSLRSGYQAQLEAWLFDREIDLAIMPLESRPPRTLHRLPLVRLPLALIVPRRSAYRTAADVLAISSEPPPLISPPDTEPISRNFQRGLAQRRRTWTPAIVASSLETVSRYVADGHGIGISVAASVPHFPVRVLPLSDFAPLEIVALWLGQPPPIVQATLEEIREYTRRTWPDAVTK